MTKEEKIDKIAQTWLNRMDLDNLEEFYYDITKDYLEDLSENDLEDEYLDAIEDE